MRLKSEKDEHETELADDESGAEHNELRKKEPEEEAGRRRV